MTRAKPGLVDYRRARYSRTFKRDELLRQKAMADERIALPRKDEAHHDLGSLKLDRTAIAEHERRRNQASSGVDAELTNPGLISARRTDGLHHDIISLAKSMSSTEALPPGSVGSGKGLGVLSSLSSLSLGALSPGGKLRIVHFSDTHNRLVPRQKKGGSLSLPAGDIFIHSGNFSLTGSAEDYAQFNNWLESVSDLYPYRIVVLGSKDVKETGTRWDKAKAMLSNATHVLCHEACVVRGLKVYGCSWHWGVKSNGTIRSGAPGGTSLRYDEIPAGIDVLITHGPSFGVLDKVGGAKEHWGSRELTDHLKRVEPLLHLHGHVKESRGWKAAFNKAPPTLNSCQTDTDKADAVLCFAPHVVSAERVGEGYHFRLAPLET